MNKIAELKEVYRQISKLLKKAPTMKPSELKRTIAQLETINEEMCEMSLKLLSKTLVYEHEGNVSSTDTKIGRPDGI